MNTATNQRMIVWRRGGRGPCPSWQPNRILAANRCILQTRHVGPHWDGVNEWPRGGSIEAAS